MKKMKSEKEIKSFKKGKKTKSIKRKSKRGKGFIDKIIDILPFEMHVPGGYQYCGPGTKLEKRLKRGDPGINPLDSACKEHDIAYDKSKDSKIRSLADKKLQDIALNRVISKDASTGERAAAILVSGAMKSKRSLAKIGSGLKKIKKNRSKKKKSHHITLKSLIKDAKMAIKKSKPDNIESAINVAVESVKRKMKKGRKVKAPRVIKVPTYSGGVLPLIPIFAGLSALGSIVGGTSSVVKAINDYKNAHNQLEESKRHNEKIEAIAIGKGYFLKPYKNGYGFFLKSPKNQ